MNDIRVEFGTLIDVFGMPATHGRFKFIPAAVELVGNSFSMSFRLRDSVGEPLPSVLAHPIEHQYEAAWVRGRLPCVFKFTPELSEGEKCLLYVGLVAVAVTKEGMVGLPFVCTDYYGNVGLMFSSDGPSHDIQAEIAAAFWSLLLQTSEELADFEEAVYHPGAGIWMHYGCEDGVPSYRESED